MAIDPEYLVRLKSKHNLIEAMEQLTDLRQVGGDYLGLCPFHDENSPSMRVNERRFRCFGCGANGDIVDLTMRTQGVRFVDAIKALADTEDLPQSNKPRPARPEATVSSYDAETKRRIIETNTEFQKLLRAAYHNSPDAYRYLSSRLSDSWIDKFGLGYAPESLISTHCNISHELLIEAAICAPSEYGGVYFRLQGRITIPLYDRRGHILGFAGRILPHFSTEGLNKYINPPNTAAFQRRRYLYGFIDGPDSINLVEGYFDVMNLVSQGENALACMGTHLTGEQKRLLQYHNKPINIIMDGDLPGLEAAANIAKGLPDAVVTLLTDKRDPGDISLAALRQATTVPTSFFNNYTQGIQMGRNVKYDYTKLDEYAQRYVNSNIQDGYPHYNVIAFVVAAYPQYAEEIRDTYRAMLKNAYPMPDGRLGFKKEYIEAFIRAWAKPCRDVRRGKYGKKVQG